MTEIKSCFLQILRSALRGELYSGSCKLSLEEWRELFSLASAHNVLPLVYQAVYLLPELKDVSELRASVRRLVVLQTMKTAEFLPVNQALREAGVTPVIVKGIICRNLYPVPDLRLSSDEDMLIPEEQYEKVHECLLEQGMYTTVKDSQRVKEYEVPYHKKDGVLYLELHKNLFAPQADAYGDWNRFFEDSMENSIKIDGVRTLCHTDHLFYLICHAFKHFIHSGCGIRQVCDIVMFANAYGNEVNWQQIYQNCCEIHAEHFAAALFKIGQKYLTLDPEKAAYPAAWRQIEVDETHILEDLLSSGIYGGSTMSRKHSSNMTLEAVSADRKGKKAGVSLKKSLFPSVKSLEHRYPYLKKHPYFLPVAWFSRILKYGWEQKGKANNSPVESLKIGSERVELLREYKIIK